MDTRLTADEIMAWLREHPTDALIVGQRLKMARWNGDLLEAVIPWGNSEYGTEDVGGISQDDEGNGWYAWGSWRSVSKAEAKAEVEANARRKQWIIL